MTVRSSLSYLLALLGLTLWSCEQPTERMAGYAVHGIDVSQQQVHFAFIKATEGSDFVDSLFCHNWEELQRVGLKRGAYHFFRPQTSAEAQANNFFRNVPAAYGDLPPVIDVEVLDGVSKNELIAGLQQWLFLAEIHYNVRPIIYSNLHFYNRYLAGHFQEYPLWLARYNDRQPQLADGHTWQFWQYGDRGALPGVRGPVDLNVFSGTLYDLENLCLGPQTVLSEDMFRH